jgi:hypothetical protein
LARLEWSYLLKSVRLPLQVGEWGQVILDDMTWVHPDGSLYVPDEPSVPCTVSRHGSLDVGLRREGGMTCGQIVLMFKPT